MQASQDNTVSMPNIDGTKAGESDKKTPYANDDMKAHIQRDLSKFLDNGIVDSDAEAERVGHILQYGSLACCTAYATLTFLVFRFSPVSLYQEPSGTEQMIHIMTGFLLLILNATIFLPLYFRDQNLKFMKSGVLLASNTIQGIAICNNLYMGFYPTPVAYDHIAHVNSHLLRWAEWAPLSFLMMFLTVNVDASHRPNEPIAIIVPLLVGYCSLGGMALPFCPNLRIWCLVLASSWFTFMSTYWILYKRAMAYRKAKKQHELNREGGKDNGTTGQDLVVQWCAYNLSICCTVCWTTLAVFFTASNLITSYTPSWFEREILPTVITCAFEIVNKVWYLYAMIDVYDCIFDEKSRAVRRLEELRNFMSAVWESSTDVIVFCDAQNDHVKARISPAFLELVGLTTGRLSFMDRGDVSLVMEILPESDQFYVLAMDLSKPVTRKDAARFQNSLAAFQLDYSLSEASIEQRNMSHMAQLVLKSCKIRETKVTEVELFESLVRCDVSGKECNVRCEAKITRLNQASCVLVLRDISDRLKRFELEKNMVEEMTIRRKDIEANRFARHEVKNGILSAIGILDHARECYSRNAIKLAPDLVIKNEVGEKRMVSCDGQPMEIDSTFGELDSTLRDTLDSVLDEACAREIVYGEYQCKNEPINVPEALKSLRRRTCERFPLHISPEAFPELALDRQLLRFIYRNAVSNAVKYGQVGGVIETCITYDSTTEILTMEIINLPGENHEDLLRLSDAEVETVFLPGVQLNVVRAALSHFAQVVRNTSSGNGAWIQQQCAKALGGECGLRFETNRTVFTFSVKSPSLELTENDDESDDDFAIPENTWGVAIDDSAIQRKLMDRFLGMAGIEKERRVVLGENSTEIYGFCDTIEKLMTENPNDLFLVIADENLDIEEIGTNKTVSGSTCVQNLLRRLPKESEERILALIRSANDSTSEIQLYSERAHGYLLKQPIKKGRVLDVLKPWWISRFSSSSKRGSRSRLHRLDAKLGRGQSDFFGCSSMDIRKSLDVISGLIGSKENPQLENFWHTIHDKLHALKGDMMTLPSVLPIREVVVLLDELLSSEKLPQHLSLKWSDLRQLILNML